MTGPTPYRIELRGRLSDETLGPYVYEFVVARSEHHTVLSGMVRDPSHLHGIITHLTNLGIVILSVAATQPNRP